ncbi:MAG TPA: flippase-like domain-containing protein [Myxococcota bacterium]|nr:flippase-like domain-containing protein [Myxococcota bacterium]HQK51291.1 flippase-like domain-containing protein [Myxococcota bacterium]
MRRWNLLFFGVGLAFLGLTLWKVGLREVIEGAVQLGWWFWPVTAVNLLWYAADAMGWGAVLGRETRFPGRAGRLVLAQVAGEALNNATPLMNLGGEPVKGLMFRDRLPADQVVSSLVVDNTLKYVATIVFLGIGLGISLFVLPLERPVQAGLVAAFGVVTLAIALAVAAQASGLLQKGLSLGGRLGLSRRFVERHLPAARRIDLAIREFYASRRGAFAMSLGWHLASRAIATIDAWWILWLMGAPVNLLTALFIQTISVLLNLVFAFIPLQIGAAEGGHYLLFQVLSLDPATGVVFSLIRRVRGLLWIALGLLIVLVTGRRTHGT